MKTSLTPGLAFTFHYLVPEAKTVPHVYPESQRFQEMPHVFATAYMVGLVEWACMEAMQPHLDAGEKSVGTGIWMTHTAATPPGLTVKVEISLIEVQGRRLKFSVKAHDGVDPIGEGTHERVVVDPARFMKKVEEKAAKAR
jgi:fluoroacetyl-CoA thioesterase